MSAIGSYNIQSGDTLSQISARLGMSMEQLQSFNPQIKDVNMIYAGDTLKLSGNGQGQGQGDGVSGPDGNGSVEQNSGVQTTGNNAAAIAESLLGRNAGELKYSDDLPMEDWVPNNVNCANFVSGCLIKAGAISPGQGSASVAQLDANLQSDGWQKVSLADAKPGDVVIMPGRHVVLFAGHDANGNPKFIGSNNINADGSQQVSWGGASGSYHILSKPA